MLIIGTLLLIAAVIAVALSLVAERKTEARREAIIRALSAVC